MGRPRAKEYERPPWLWRRMTRLRRANSGVTCAKRSRIQNSCQQNGTFALCKSWPRAPNGLSSESRQLSELIEGRALDWGWLEASLKARRASSVLTFGRTFNVGLDVVVVVIVVIATSLWSHPSWFSVDLRKRIGGGTSLKGRLVSR